MTDTATLSATRVGIARPNATNVFVSQQFGLLMVSHCSANVSSIPGATTVQVNLPANHPDFQVGTEYIVGGQLSDPPAEYIEPFGLDASDPAFWQRGLSVVAGFIDELEKLG